MSRCTTALIIVLTSTFLMTAGIDSSALPSETKGSYSVENQDNTPTVRGEKSETIKQEGPSDSGEPAAPPHPTVTASDPSMWEDQPHRDCSPKPGKGLEEAMGCEFGRKATGPQDNTPDTGSGSEPRTVTITTRQAATWTAGCFSDTACLVFQAALVRPRNSCSTSLGVRYPRAE